MSEAVISPRTSVIKVATRTAIEAAGGYEVAKASTRARQTQLWRYAAPREADTISMEDALALDSVTSARGGPFHLHAMARLLNHVAIPLPEAAAGAEGITASLMDLTSELGDVAQKIREGLRHDGKLQAGEIMAVLDELAEMFRAGASLKVKLVDELEGRR